MRKCGIKLAHEYGSTPFLIILVILISRLDVDVRREEKNKIAHAAEPRIRCLTASQVVTCVGSFR